LYIAKLKAQYQTQKLHFTTFAAWQMSPLRSSFGLFLLLGISYPGFTQSLRIKQPSRRQSRLRLLFCALYERHLSDTSSNLCHCPSKPGRAHQDSPLEYQRASAPLYQCVAVHIIPSITQDDCESYRLLR
jgi:hypothetical protein